MIVSSSPEKADQVHKQIFSTKLSSEEAHTKFGSQYDIEDQSF